MRATARSLARLHGLFNVTAGAWPILSIRSFEAVTGPKVDRWLVRTVGGLLCAIGATQLLASRRDTVGPDVRLLSIAAPAVLGTIAVVYAAKGRISKVYLLDGVMEAGWVASWAAVTARER
jgi:hypothetical protein